MNVPSETVDDLAFSIVMPAFDEAENLPAVVTECLEVAAGFGEPFELIVVDDGSRDATPEVMASLREAHPEVRSVRLRRNLGKSAALDATRDRVRGRRVVLMDADGQDDPHELPSMFEALDGGLDLVTGRRATRRDRFVKRQTSRFYNWFTTWVTGLEGSDFNSGFKAMDRTVFARIRIYGELHRYIPVLAHWAGFRVGEIDVNHRERARGSSKFGRARFWRGFLDLLTVKFLVSYQRRPFHLFGGVGACLGAAGGVLLGWMAVSKTMGNPVGQRPALTIGVLLVVVGVQLASVGLVGELLLHLELSRDRNEPVIEE